jgi:hypothetical protein
VAEHDPYPGPGVVEKAEQASKTRERMLEELEDADLRWLMQGGRKGRRIASRLILKAQVDTDPYSPNLSQMSRNTGKQWYGRWLKRKLERLCPEEYLLMQQENDGW